MQAPLLVLHLLICMVLVFAVLMQRSEGGALGVGGGGGGLISGRGAADMMVNITSWVGGLFFVTSMLLAVLASQRPADRSVITDGQRPQSGFHLNLPFLNQKPKQPAAAVETTAPSPDLPAPSAAPTPVGAAVAPTPVEAVAHAGPLEPSAPVATPGASPRSPTATAPRPVGAQGAVVAGPIGATPGGAVAASPSKDSQRAAPKAQRVAPVPMIPLPVETLPVTAPATESPQPATPAPSPAARTGPDE